MNKMLLKFLPEYQCTCLWKMEKDIYTPVVSYAELGLPLDLIASLEAFDLAIMNIIDWDDPSGPSPLTIEERLTLYHTGLALYEKVNAFLKEDYNMSNHLDWINPLKH